MGVPKIHLCENIWNSVPNAKEDRRERQHNRRTGEPPCRSLEQFSSLKLGFVLFPLGLELPVLSLKERC
jgi:hypothetical protein